VYTKWSWCPRFESVSAPKFQNACKAAVVVAPAKRALYRFESARRHFPAFRHGEAAQADSGLWSAKRGWLARADRGAPATARARGDRADPRAGVADPGRLAAQLSTRLDDQDDLTRSGRISQPGYQVEGLVRDNRVEVRVLFGRTSQKPRSPGGVSSFLPEVRRLIVRPKAITAYRSGGRRMRGTSAGELTVTPYPPPAGTRCLSDSIPSTLQRRRSARARQAQRRRRRRDSRSSSIQGRSFAKGSAATRTPSTQRRAHR
jgi:hypothetical protein